MKRVLTTAADARFGLWVINLVGSIKRKSDLFDVLVVYDLGLSPFQRRLLDGVRGVEIRAVPPFVPHWRQGRTWKTWIWTHCEADTLVWLDAGVTVLQPMTDFLAEIDEYGYFVVSSGVANGDSTPSDYYGLYELDLEFAGLTTITAGILGFRRDAPFYRDVIVPTFDDAALGRSLGFSPGEADKLNRGLDRLDTLIVRDCHRFRHEQTLLSIHFYRSTLDPRVQDLYRFGGWKSSRDHPEQVIWNHRRRGDYRFLPRVPYRPATAMVGIPWGLWIFLRANRGWLPSWLLRRARGLIPQRH